MVGNPNKVRIRMKACLEKEKNDFKIVLKIFSHRKTIYSISVNVKRSN